MEFCFGKVRVLLCDLAHNVVATAECDLPRAHSSDTALAAAGRLVAKALADAGLPRDALIAAGVSVPGPVSRHPDTVTPSAILPGWHGVTGDDIAAALGVAVSIDNDSNLAALGEHVWGAGRGCVDSVTLKFHYGIGCGLFVNGSLVRGSGGAGEIGHIAVDERGPLCRCGKRGCLETYAAISAIMEALRPQHGELTLPELLRLLAARDPGAVRVVGDAAELVGTHLAAVCNLLAPSMVIVTGPMARAGRAGPRPDQGRDPPAHRAQRGPAGRARLARQQEHRARRDRPRTRRDRVAACQARASVTGSSRTVACSTRHRTAAPPGVRLPVDLLDLVLEQLPGRRARQLVGEDEAARDLEAGDPAAQVGGQLSGELGRRARRPPTAARPP